MHCHKVAYCSICHATTRWELYDGDSVDVVRFQCHGDDERHPERRVHGCGTLISEDEFKKRRKESRHVG